MKSIFEMLEIIFTDNLKTKLWNVLQKEWINVNSEIIKQINI